MNVSRGIMALALLVLLAGCGDKTEGSAQPAGSASGRAAAGSSGAAAASSGAAAPLRDAAGKLTKAGFDAAWKEVYMDMKAMSDPPEKKAAAFEAKVGKPAKVEGDTKVWWAFDGATCYREELGKDGTKGDEKVTPEKCEK